MEHILQTRTQWLSIGRTYSFSNWNYPILNVHKKTESKSYVISLEKYCLLYLKCSSDSAFATSTVVNYLMLDVLFPLWLI